MGGVWQDVRYALRMLLTSPGFTAIAVLSLALGIGANTTIFSLINAVLLRPLPGPDPERLATVYTSDYSGPLYGASSYPDYIDFRDGNDVFSDLAAYTIEPFVVTVRGESHRIFGELVTANYFDLLGIGASLGRTFVPGAEATEGSPATVVLSDGLWQRRFGADPTVVGSTIDLNGQPTTVIGVAPPGFTGMVRGISADLWFPLALEGRLRPGSSMLEQRGARGLFLFGRLKPGVTVLEAQANFRVMGQQLYEAYPDYWDNVRDEPRVVTVLSSGQSRVPPFLRGALVGFMGLLLVVVGLVLLIACFNVANLLLAQAMRRRREMAVRVSLGAGRRRLVRQLLTESLLLSLLAGALGVLIAFWATRVLMAFQPPLPLTLALDLGLDSRVLTFTLAVSLLTALLFGLAPAVQSARADVASTLRDESAGSTGGLRRVSLRNLLVVGQVAVSLLLLIGAGLFLRSLANASAIDPGFDPENVLVASVDLDLQDYSEAEGRRFFEELQERLGNLPQVRSVSLAQFLPLGLISARRSVSIEGYEPQPGEDMEIHYNFVGAGYFETMRTPLVRGRSFRREDSADAPGVVIVNEAFGRRYWPGEDPLGKRMGMGSGEGELPLEVVGVAKDGKYQTLGEEPRPFVYYPHAQNYRGSKTILIRTTDDPQHLVPALRSEVRALDAKLPVFGVTTLTEHMGISLFPVRMAAILLATFGALALVLAAGGIYGVISYLVSQRAQEIGIRMALGAERRDIVRLVLSQGMGLALVGLALGLGAAFGVTRFLGFLLYSISATDPWTFVGICALLAVVAGVACGIPSRRASRIDPAVSLRYE